MRKFALILLVGLAAAELIGQAQSPPVPSSPSPPGPARLSPGDILENYARLTGRTILRPSNLALPADIGDRLPANTNAAIALIESKFARNHIEVVQDGDKFVRLLPVGMQSAQLALIKLRHSSSRELIPAGTIDFRAVGVKEVVTVYAELRDRTILRSAMLQDLPIALRTQNALTKDEAVYALEIVMALNGVATVDDGNKFVQVVQLSQASQVQTRAPKPELNANLIDPRKVPVLKTVGAMYRPKPASTPPTFIERITRAYASFHKMLFGPPPTPPKPNVDNLIAYYAKLVGRTAVPSKFGGQSPIFFELRTPLTKAELVYAIEATLALDGLKIVPADNKSIRADHIPGLRKPE